MWQKKNILQTIIETDNEMLTNEHRDDSIKSNS